MRLIGKRRRRRSGSPLRRSPTARLGTLAVRSLGVLVLVAGAGVGLAQLDVPVELQVWLQSIAGPALEALEGSAIPLRLDLGIDWQHGAAWATALVILIVLTWPVVAWWARRGQRGQAAALAQKAAQRAEELQRTTEQLREALTTVKHRAEETDRVLELAEAVGSTLEQKELFEIIAKGAARACGADRCSIFLRDKSGQLMVPVSSQFGDGAADLQTSEGFDVLHPVALDEVPPFLLEAVRRQEPVVISDLGADPRVPPRWTDRFQAKSALVVPLIHQGRTAGVLILDHLRALHSFTPDETRLATTLAAQAAVALEKARLYDEIQQRLEQTETLLAVSQAIGSAPDLTEAVRRTTREMVRLLGADLGAAWCVSRSGDRFVPLAGYHVPRELREELTGKPLAPDDALVSLVRRLQTALYSSNSKTDPRFNHPVIQMIPHTSLLMQPIRVGDEVLGIFAVFWRHEAHAFTSDELRLVDGIARQAAVAIELHRTQRHITEQERLNAVGKMASGLAHDFNNALVPIFGYTEMLLEHPDILEDRERAARYLRLIMTGVRDAASVVSRLREFYRRREETDVFHPLRLNQLVEQAVALTRPRWRDEALASGRTILVETDLGTVPRVLGSEPELRELLTNLIFNAVDAMPEGGTITVRTGCVEAKPGPGERSSARAAQVFVEVGDTGTGMTEEVRRRCLEPFFSTKGERGSGLGLSMVYGIVKRHHGSIDIQTELGRGTTFSVRLPADATPEAGDAEPSLAPSASLRVLVVDDEAVARDVLREYLTRDGHTVETATNGHEGLEKFSAGRFDVVVTDRAMPVLSGDQMAGMIKQSAPGVPVVLLTGFGELMKAAGEKPVGVDLVVNKPVRLAALREVLARVTEGTGRTQ